MNVRRKIALVGLSSLESIGIRSLIHHRHDIKVERFVSLEHLPKDDEQDAYIVGADSFTANLDFFMPRKQKTLVVINDCLSNKSNNGINIVSTYSDEMEIDKSLSFLIESLEDNESQHGNLSAREIEVLKLISSGRINKEIADELCISVNTVITHRKNISSKLGIKSASGLSLYAAMNGII